MWWEDNLVYIDEKKVSPIRSDVLQEGESPVSQLTT